MKYITTPDGHNVITMDGRNVAYCDDSKNALLVCAALNRVSVEAIRARMKHLQNQLSGLLAPTYFRDVPLQGIRELCEQNGFSADLGNGDKLDNGTVRYHEAIGDNYYLTLTVYKMESGRYEVCGYIS